MAFELKQNLKLSQQLIMTPQLQQAIKLLQLSRLELVDVIQQEIEENPLLEEMTGEDDIDVEAEVKISSDGEPESIKPPAGPSDELTGEGDGKEEFDWNSYLEDYGPMGVTYSKEDIEGPTWENVLTKSSSLTDHLLWQLNLSRFSELERKVGEQIIGNLDPNGYLAATFEEVTVEGADEEFVESVLLKIQQFDPPGIAARDLKECLLIQSRMLGSPNPLAEAIISEHLKDLETKNYNQIVRKLKVTLNDVLNAVALISSMDPKPGRLYNEDKDQYIVPDVYVFKVGDEYKIVINEDGLPRLRISNFYKEIMSGISNGTEGTDNCKDYIKERIHSATWLIKSIQQRQRTIYRVSESIVKYQRDFFDNGINFLKPMVLRDVADSVEMHESTISRVTTNKYMHTPRGIFELKYFFNSGINKTSGDAIASKSVQEEIKKIVQGENKQQPYSDNEIVDILKNSGIEIARRTVAKYREMLGILPSSKRKTFFTAVKD